jgi:hypothetical protein
MKWDKSIESSRNRLIYAYSWYLDIVSPGWEAIADDDYQTVMPLPVKSKFGLKYLVQPVFTQQLGIFSASNLSETVVWEYISRIPKKYFRQIFNLNSANILSPSTKLTNRSNYELDLNRNYSELYQHFNENTRRNIKKAGNSGCLPEKSSDVVLFLAHYQKNAKERLNGFMLEKLKYIISTCLLRNKGEVYWARNKQGNMIAGTFFIADEDRIIYAASFSTQEGMENSAMFYIINEIIRQNANSPKVLDFEGSMIPGVARFFAGFGAEIKIYQQYKKVW